MLVNQSAPGLNQSLSPNICRIRSADHAKFIKYVLVKKNVYK